MKNIGSICLAVATLETSMAETSPEIQADVQKMVEASLKAIALEEERRGEKIVHAQIKEGKSCEKRCQGQLFMDEEESKKESSSNDKNAVLVFASTSMPKASLKALFLEAERIGGRLVFRGLVNNSFKETLKTFEEIGVNGDIDPELFDKHAITSVPTITLISTEHDKKPVVDHVVGNVSLVAALELVREKGVCVQLAETLLERVRT
jgi:conjugal transfer pilus assembly protein TrbC